MKVNTPNPIGISLLLFFSLFFYLPLLFLLFFSFTEFQYGTPISYFSLKNYESLFISDLYFNSFLKNCLIAIASAAIATCFGFIILSLVWRLKSTSTRNLILVLLIIAFFTGILPKSFALQQGLSEGKVLNQLFNVMNSANPTLFQLFQLDSIILTNLIIFTPLSLGLLFPTRLAIHESFIQSANEMGANSWQLNMKVIIPLMYPGLTLSFILIFLLVFGDSIVTDVIGGSAVYTSSLFITDKFKINDFGSAAAAGAIALVIVTMFISFFSIWIKRLMNVNW